MTISRSPGRASSDAATDDEIDGDPDLRAAVPRPRSIADIFRDERHRLTRALARRLRDPEEAADMVQEAFARLAARPIETLIKPQAYLQRIVGNLLLDRRKRAQNRFAWIPLGPAHQEIAAAPEQTWSIEVSDLIARYRIAVAALPPRTREVFLLHRVDELRYRDIAERLGITIATVEYHMARALARLAEALDQ